MAGEGDTLPSIQIVVAVRSESRHATGVFNLIAMAAVLAITAILVIGINESANFNSAIVIVKLAIIPIFLASRC